MIDYSKLSNADSEEGYFQESVAILPEAINEEFVRVPADLAYWGEKYAEAVKTYLVAENNVKKLKAHLRLSVRETAAAKGQKMTEGDVDAWVEQAPQYQDAKLAEIEAEASKIAAKARFDAVLAKRDMCMSLGAHIRAEMAPSHLNSGRR